MKLIKFFSIASAALMMWSCQKEEINIITEDNGNTPTENVEIKSLMGINNFPLTNDGNGSHYLGDMHVFENSIDEPNSSAKVLSPVLPEKAPLAIGSSRIRKWPNNTVVYKMGNLTADMRDRFEQAMNEWSSKTNVRFVEHTTQNDYVNIEPTGDACFCGVASLGVQNFQGRRGFLRFGSRAPLSVVIHEIGHTLGFIHEQNRSDRDNVITVNFDNITQGGADQYFKSDASINLTDNLDPLSIMMYSNNTFGNGNGPTMTYRDGSALPRKTGRLSAGDIAGANQAYPGSTGGGDPVVNPPTNPEDACSGVSEWSRTRTYRVGDRVTFQGYLYERDFSRWNLLQKCGAPARDICEGIEPYNGGSYSVGDKVTFRGELYRRVEGGWVKEGQCNG